jgi:hypothetical protein
MRPKQQSDCKTNWREIRICNHGIKRKKKEYLFFSNRTTRWKIVVPFSQCLNNAQIYFSHNNRPHPQTFVNTSIFIPIIFSSSVDWVFFCYSMNFLQDVDVDDGLKILSRVWVTREGVWIGNCFYWTLIHTIRFWIHATYEYVKWMLCNNCNKYRKEYVTNFILLECLSVLWDLFQLLPIRGGNLLWNDCLSGCRRSSSSHTLGMENIGRNLRDWYSIIEAVNK